MLAEKFILLLEALIRSCYDQSYADGAPKVVSRSPHVPVKILGNWRGIEAPRRNSPARL